MFTEDMLAKIQKEYVQPGEWQQRMITAYLTVLLTHLSRVYSEQHEKTQPSGDRFLLRKTNFFGAIATTQAFLDMLKNSSQPRIVNVTSGLSSLTLHSDPTWKYYHVKGACYTSSKAALNAYTIVLAYELRDTPFKVNVVDPGYTATDFNHHTGPGSVEDAAARLVKAAILEADGPTGQFFSDDNLPETGISPW